MKVRTIELDGYNQFKGVKIDLTYPKGHKKEGKPLEKICFIGQSGTGKTSILRLIKWFVTFNKKIGKNLHIVVPGNDKIKFEMQVSNLKFCLASGTDGLIFKNAKFESDSVDLEKFITLRDDLIKKTLPLLVNFPTETIYTEILNIEPKDPIPTQLALKNRIEYLEALNPKQVMDYAIDAIDKTFEYLLKEISEHRAEEIVYKNKISNEALKINSKSEDIEKANNVYRDWLKKNPNPLEKLANNLLNDILKLLGLKVKTDLDKSAVLHINNIEIQTLDGVDIPYHFWSTGTKHLVNLFLPLYELKPQNAIILIDEPERSLYPDMQRMVVDKCVSLGTDCQYFFATHSPIIASSFDPWEIIELKFDESNKHIYQEQYYTGERHVDNYKFNPKYMSWDSILNQVFDIEGDGNPERQLKINDLAKINQRIVKKKQKETKETLLKDADYLKDVEDFKIFANQLKWNLGGVEI